MGVFQKFGVLGFSVLWSVASVAADFDRQGDTRTQPVEVVEADQNRGLEFGAGATLNRGNIDRTMAYLDLKIFNQTPRVGTHISGNYFYGSINGTRFSHKAGGSLRLDYRLLDDLKLFLYTTHGANEFLKLDYRSANGIGPWLDLRSKDFVNSFSIAASWEFERFTDLPIERTARVSFRNLMKWDVSETAQIGLDFFYIPSTADWKDFRVYVIPSIQADVVGDSLGLKYQLIFERDTRPKPGVVANDVEMVTSFVFRI